MSVYSSIIKRIHRSGLCQKSQKDIKQINELLSSAIGRRLLYRELSRLGKLSLLDTVPITDDVNRTLISSAVQLAKQGAPGHVLIEGNPADMSVSQWLTIEHELTKALLTKKNHAQIDLDHLRNTLGNNMRIPCVLSSESVGLLTVFTGPLIYFGASVLALLAPLFLNLLDVTRHMQIAAGNLLLSMLFGGVVGSVMNIFYLLIDRGVRHDLSTDWDDVLNLETPADAILMGMIETSMLELMQPPNKAVPDLLSQSPQQALAFMMSFLHENERASSEDVAKVLSVCAPFNTDKASDPNAQKHTMTRSDHATNTICEVHGIDLSILVAKHTEIETPSLQQEPQKGEHVPLKVS